MRYCSIVMLPSGNMDELTAEQEADLVRRVRQAGLALKAANDRHPDQAGAPSQANCPPRLRWGPIRLDGVGLDEIDPALASRIRDGMEAFERLTRALLDPFKAHLRVRLGGGPTDADDVAQAVWTALWRSLAFSAEYQADKGRLYTYLLSFLARRAVARAFEKSRRESDLKQRVRVALGLSSGGESGGAWDAEEATEGTQPMKPAPHHLPAAEVQGPDAEWVAIEEQQERLAAEEELMCLLFRHGGYPHEVLTFGFAKVVSGQPSPRGIESDLQAVDRCYGAQPMAPLPDIIAERFAEQSGFSETALRRVFDGLTPLRENLRLPFRQLAESRKPRDIRSLNRGPVWLLDQITGDSAIRDYAAATGRPTTEAMTMWCDTLGRRLRALLGVGKGPSRADIAEVMARCIQQIDER